MVIFFNLNWGWLMDKKDFNDGLIGFLDASPTPFHAVKNMCGMLKNAGFEELDESCDFNLLKGGKYFVTRNDSSLIAFNYGMGRDYTIVATHTDSPNLKLKPNPLIKEHGVVKFGVESYGGMLLNSWFDRDLSLAGRVSYVDSSNQLQDAIIDIKKPIAVIPSLAIHLDDKANKDKTINKQTDICPIVSCDKDFEFDTFLKEYLKKNGYDADKIYAHELSLYDTQKASCLGMDDEFITASRIDNLLSCYVALLNICSVCESKPVMLVATDHEEVGSVSMAGADSGFLQDILKRVFVEKEEYYKTLSSSFLISCDNAHAIHPNFASKHDGNHTPFVNGGVVVKTNANQRYTSNSKTVARFKKVADEVGESVQDFVSRSDMGCGSTIGPAISSKLGIKSIDIGVPTWAMHSIREVCGVDDAYSLYKILVNI